MRISNAVGYALTAAVALTMLAVRSGGASPVVPALRVQPRAGSQSAQHQAFQTGRPNSLPDMRGGIVRRHRGVTTPSFMDRGAVGKPLIFVVDGFNAVAYIFLQGKSHKAVGQISGPPSGFFNGAATDSARNLYLTNASSILVYAPPYTGAPATLQDAGNAAWDVAVSRAGVVGVANECTLPSCALNTGSVTLYGPNSTQPCTTVAVKANVQYDAFDNKGNLFFAGIYFPSRGGFATQGYSVIGEVKGGCTAKKSALLTTNNSIRGYAVHIDKADRIAILDYSISGSFTIYTYNHPKNGSLGDPVSNTPLATPNLIDDFAFLASGNDLYTAEAPYSSNAGFSSEYDYPGGGAPESTFEVFPSNGLPTGIAVTPPLVP